MSTAKENFPTRLPVLKTKASISDKHGCKTNRSSQERLSATSPRRLRQSTSTSPLRCDLSKSTVQTIATPAAKHSSIERVQTDTDPAFTKIFEKRSPTVPLAPVLHTEQRALQRTGSPDKMARPRNRITLDHQDHTYQTQQPHVEQDEDERGSRATRTGASRSQVRRLQPIRPRLAEPMEPRGMYAVQDASHRYYHRNDVWHSDDFPAHHVHNPILPRSSANPAHYVPHPSTSQQYTNPGGQSTARPPSYEEARMAPQCASNHVLRGYTQDANPSQHVPTSAYHEHGYGHGQAQAHVPSICGRQSSRTPGRPEPISQRTPRVSHFAASRASSVSTTPRRHCRTGASSPTSPTSALDRFSITSPTTSRVMPASSRRPSTALTARERRAVIEEMDRRERRPSLMPITQRRERSSRTSYDSRDDYRPLHDPSLNHATAGLSFRGGPRGYAHTETPAESSRQLRQRLEAVSTVTRPSHSPSPIASPTDRFITRAAASRVLDDTFAASSSRRDSADAHGQYTGIGAPYNSPVADDSRRSSTRSPEKDETHFEAKNKPKPPRREDDSDGDEGDYRDYRSSGHNGSSYYSKHGSYTKSGRGNGDNSTSRSGRGGNPPTNVYSCALAKESTASVSSTLNGSAPWFVPQNGRFEQMLPREQLVRSVNWHKEEGKIPCGFGERAKFNQGGYRCRVV